MISAYTHLFNMSEQIEDDRADAERANEPAERRVTLYMARYQGHSQACHHENVSSPVIVAGFGHRCHIVSIPL